MNPMQAMPNEEAAPGESQGESEAEAQGQTFCVVAKPDGSFQVYKEGDENAKPIEAPDLEGALKGLVKMVQANPSDSNPQAHFQAGFKGEQQAGY